MENLKATDNDLGSRHVQIGWLCLVGCTAGRNNLKP